MPASRGDRFRTVTNHLPAIEQFRDKRMSLEALKLSMRIGQRITIVQASHVSKIHNPVLHSVNPAAAIRPLVGRKTKRVGHPTGWVAIVRQFPELLYAQAVHLGLAPLIKSQPANQRL